MIQVLQSHEPSHVKHVMANLRQADAAELHSFSGGMTPLAAMMCCTLFAEQRYTIIRGTTPVGIGGISADGVLWLVGTNDMLLPDVRRFLIHQSKPWFDYMNTLHPLLWNWVDSRNTVHLRWLRFAGCQFKPERDMVAADGTPFLYFERTSNVH